jgi:hypothetical protein
METKSQRQKELTNFLPRKGALASLSQREGDVHKHDDVGDSWKQKSKHHN